MDLGIEQDRRKETKEGGEKGRSDPDYTDHICGEKPFIAGDRKGVKDRRKVARLKRMENAEVKNVLFEGTIVVAHIGREGGT